MAQEIYFNINDNHFKIWGFDCFRSTNGGKHTLITYWGKIGLPMERLQKKEKYFENWHDLYDYIWDKMKEKIDLHGYYVMPNSKYFDAINSEKPLSQLIRLMECYKKEQSKLNITNN